MMREAYHAKGLFSIQAKHLELFVSNQYFVIKIAVVVVGRG